MSNLPSLYVITSDMLSLLDSDESTDEQIEAAFGAIVEKDNRICHFRADIIGEIAKFKAEESRLAARRKSMENLVARLEGYISQSMERLQVDEVQAGTFSIKLQNTPPAVDVDDESLIPAEYFVVIPATTQLDKKKVSADLKSGKEVLGCHLKRGKSLRIR